MSADLSDSLRARRSWDQVSAYGRTGLCPTQPPAQWVSSSFFFTSESAGRGVDHAPPHLEPKLKKE